jgi:hypothetical protein
MDERRQYQRHETNIDIRLQFQGQEIPCQMKNLSEGGSLLIVDPDPGAALTQACIGEEATFHLNKVQTKGTIVRVLESGGVKLIALRYLGHSIQEEIQGL